MAKSDVVQTESKTDAVTALRLELEPKIESKTPLWAFKLFASIIVAAILAMCGFGIAQVMSINADISKQNFELGQRITVLETKMGIHR